MQHLDRNFMAEKNTNNIGVLLCFADQKGNAGGHAVAVLINKNKVYFFDSNYGVYQLGFVNQMNEIKNHFKINYPEADFSLNGKSVHVMVY